MENLYCTFFIDKNYYAIPVFHIQEILQNQDVFKVPLAGSNVSGLINLRGQVISILNLKKILNSSEEVSKITTQLITNTSFGLLGLELDDVHEIISIPENKKIPPPATLSGSLKNFISYSYNLPENLLLVLDLESIARIQ